MTDMNFDHAPRVLYLPQTDDNPLIRMLTKMLEDARRGAITTVACITVAPNGIIQTPAEGHQVREVGMGIEVMRQRLAETYDRAMREAEIMNMPFGPRPR